MEEGKFEGMKEEEITVGRRRNERGKKKFEEGKCERGKDGR